MGRLYRTSGPYSRAPRACLPCPFICCPYTVHRRRVRACLCVHSLNWRSCYYRSAAMRQCCTVPACRLPVCCDVIRRQAGATAPIHLVGQQERCNLQSDNGRCCPMFCCILSSSAYGAPSSFPGQRKNLQLREAVPELVAKRTDFSCSPHQVFWHSDSRLLSLLSPAAQSHFITLGFHCSLFPLLSILPPASSHAATPVAFEATRPPYARC